MAIEPGDKKNKMPGWRTLVVLSLIHFYVLALLSKYCSNYSDSKVSITHADFATARALVLREPFDGDSVARLGGAFLAAGQLRRAREAFLVSREMGWRSPATLEFLVRDNLPRKNYRSAALYLDALLRQNPAMADRSDLLGLFERDSAARAALAERIAASPGWVLNYTDDWTGLSSKGRLNRAAMFVDLASREFALGCRAAAAASNGLVEVDRPDLAARIWQSHCSEPRNGPVGDNTFAAALLRNVGGPFSWTFLNNSGDVDVQLRPLSNGSQRVEVTNASWVPVAFATQMLIGAPGRYQLRVRGPPLGEKSPILAGIACEPGSKTLSPLIADLSSGEWVASLEAHASCSNWLTLGIAPRSGRIAIERVNLVPDWSD